ncbi:tRNA lysidine(34) synthetase TilS [Enterovibrio calviensis]|uniref:tRNA lysidine(34) synthetase TilS n=1 Tax=Enterovibrio calviensis TaxID=91359 RepID=UPI0004822E46|nr:tRNA lysidine(34) synthetase TilS [Enterovibrio calviensis]
MLFSVFENVLNAHAVTPRQIVLAFSGGVDSRVMLDLLSTYRDIHPQHRYLILHVHHGLSENADEWMEKCHQWSTDAGFDFRGLKVQFEKQGESLEKQAREARYSAISLNVEPEALVLTAQHSDDQAETFLLALKRGSGPAGLAAMPQIRGLAQAQLLRPLLAVSRQDIEIYANDQGLAWVEDESNLDCRFDRNFIRQVWLPKVRERWPGFVKAVNRTSMLCAEQEALIDELLEEHDARIELPDGGLSISALQTYSSRMQVALLRRWLKKVMGQSVSQVQLKEILHSVVDAACDANPEMRLGEWMLRRFQNALYCLSKMNDVTDEQRVLALNCVTDLPDNLGTLLMTESRTVHGLSLRAPRSEESVTVKFNPEGVYAHPLGRQGKRKLKKLFQEYGVPSWMRRRTPLIYFGDQLAGVADLFVCVGFEGQECELVWHKTH